MHKTLLKLVPCTIYKTTFKIIKYQGLTIDPSTKLQSFYACLCKSHKGYKKLFNSDCSS